MKKIIKKNRIHKFCHYSSSFNLTLIQQLREKEREISADIM